MLGEVSIHLDFIALNLFWKVDVFTLSLPKGTECGFSPNETILLLWVCLVLNQSSSENIQQIVQIFPQTEWAQGHNHTTFSELYIKSWVYELTPGLPSQDLSCKVKAQT